MRIANSLGLAAATLALSLGCGEAGRRSDSSGTAGGGTSAAGARNADSSAVPSTAVASGEVFVDSGACPFECCTYREWQATGSVTLREAPDSASRVLTTVASGTRVQALTGEVHVRPGRFVLAHGMRGYSLDAAVPRPAADSFATGDTLGVYTYRGEGAWKVRRLGRDEPLVELMLAWPGTGCEQNGRCDGRFLEEPRSTWWIHIRTPDGVDGWTTDAKAFSGKDRCG